MPVASMAVKAAGHDARGEDGLLLRERHAVENEHLAGDELPAVDSLERPGDGEVAFAANVYADEERWADAGLARKQFLGCVEGGVVGPMCLWGEVAARDLRWRYLLTFRRLDFSKQSLTILLKCR
jgi:hypothetical protein